MLIYSIAVTVVAIIFIAKYLKWKIATRSMVFFCMDKFREPTTKEIAKYTKLVCKNLFKRQFKKERKK